MLHLRIHRSHGPGAPLLLTRLSAVCQAARVRGPDHPGERSCGSGKDNDDVSWSQAQGDCGSETHSIDDGRTRARWFPRRSNRMEVAKSLRRQGHDAIKYVTFNKTAAADAQRQCTDIDATTAHSCAFDYMEQNEPNAAAFAKGNSPMDVGLRNERGRKEGRKEELHHP